MKHIFIFYFVLEQYHIEKKFCENIVCNNIISETKKRMIHFYEKNA